MRTYLKKHKLKDVLAKLDSIEPHKKVDEAEIIKKKDIYAKFEIERQNTLKERK